MMCPAVGRSRVASRLQTDRRRLTMARGRGLHFDGGRICSTEVLAMRRNVNARNNNWLAGAAVALVALAAWVIPAAVADEKDDAAQTAAAKTVERPKAGAHDNSPPEGFEAAFNGKDLTGWKGLVSPDK